MSPTGEILLSLSKKSILVDEAMIKFATILSNGNKKLYKYYLNDVYIRKTFELYYKKGRTI